MHAEIETFLHKFVQQSGIGTLRGRSVIEVGSFNINGSARSVLQHGTARWTGLDWREGPGVDVVTLGHAYEPSEPCDLAVSCQALEHDPYWRETLASLVRFVSSSPAGWVIVTCAGTGYVEHELDTAPAFEGQPAGTYYENRTVEEIHTALAAEAASRQLRLDFHGELARAGLDVLCWAKLTS